MLKRSPIILFFYAPGSAYYSSMPACYSILLPTLLLKINIEMARKYLAYSRKLKRKLPQPKAEAGKFFCVRCLGTFR